MQPIQFQCPCRQTMQVARSLAGKVVACPGCGKHLQVPVPQQLATAAPSGSASRSRQHRKPTVPKKKSHTGLLIGLVSLAGLLLLGVIGISIYLTMGTSESGGKVASGGTATPVIERNSNATENNQAKKTDELETPPRPKFRSAFPSGVQLATTKFRTSGPAGATKMKIYLPKGEHADGSLGCVLVAPAGTNLLMGNEPGSDYHDETLPYAEAGFAVIQYSLDGSVDLEKANMAQMSRAYNDFRSAQAGTTNAQAVIAFVKQQLPEVDPGRIYVAGHSSAGTVALNNAFLMPDDIAACIAYAPCSDTEAFHREIYAEPQALQMFPGIKQFDRKHSPIANAAKFTCPLFLFQAKGDRVVEYRETKTFADKIASLGKADITFSEIRGGDHYSPMISTGIPRAIKWLKELEK